MSSTISLTIDGVEVTANPGQTVIQAAMDAGIYIPYLCYWPGMKPYGACRMCLVEVEGQRGTPASCTLPAANGMVVRSATPQIQELREGILELLLSEHPHGCLTCHRSELCGPQDICLRHVRVTDRCVLCPKNERCELKDTVRYVRASMETPLTYAYRNLPVETADPFYDRDYNLCIVCARCVRVCEEVRGDDAIGMVDRAGTVLVGTSRGTSLLESGCEFCGACVDVCPVGALVERRHKWNKAVREVQTTCPHCPVGCQINLQVDARDRVIRGSGVWCEEANRGQLCFKGKFGMEFVSHRSRLTRPLIRRGDVLEEASWDEALDLAAERLGAHRGDAFALLMSPRSTNEEAYVAQRFARAVMGTNNVDLSSDGRPEQVLPLGRILGTMAATGSVQELEDAGCVLVVSSNTTEDHNVAAVPIKKGRRRGTLKLIVVDPREVELTRHADLWLRPHLGTEATLLGGILRAVLDEGLEDGEFLAAGCDGLDGLRDSLAPFALSAVAESTGVAEDQIAQAARWFGEERPGAIVYALDNVPLDQRTPLVETLVNLALVTGNVGRPSSGLFPLRNGANEQGAWDVGCTPALLPGYVPVDDEAVRGRFETAWGVAPPSNPGMASREAIEAMQRGDVKAAVVVGDSSAFSDDALHAMGHLDFLVVQDLFLGDLANVADVVLPLAAPAELDGTYTSLERRVQLVRCTVPPKGESRTSSWALSDLARRMGASGFDDTTPAALMGQIASLAPDYAGITHARLEQGGVQWPCPESDHPGTPRLHADGFGDRRAALSPLQAPRRPAAPPTEFPLLHVPGRVLAAQGAGIEVVRTNGRSAVRRGETVEMHPEDARSLGIVDGDDVALQTPFQRIQGRASLTGRLRGVVGTTALFGELAVDLDASTDPDPMLRVPGLDVAPARVTRTSDG